VKSFTISGASLVSRLPRLASAVGNVGLSHDSCVFPLPKLPFLLCGGWATSCYCTPDD
jgi:hypothetical protein